MLETLICIKGGDRYDSCKFEPVEGSGGDGSDGCSGNGGRGTRPIGVWSEPVLPGHVSKAVERIKKEYREIKFSIDFVDVELKECIQAALNSFSPRPIVN